MNTFLSSLVFACILYPVMQIERLHKRSLTCASTYDFILIQSFIYQDVTEEFLEREVESKSGFRAVKCRS